MLARYMPWPCVRLCRCLCLSQVGVLNESSWFWRGRFLPLILHCIMRIWVSQKIRVLPSRTLFQTLDWETFATASRWCCHQNSLAVELVDHLRRSMRLAHIDYYTSVDSNLLTRLLQLVSTVVQLLTRFRLTQRVARSVCGSRASCWTWVNYWLQAPMSSFMRIR